MSSMAAFMLELQCCIVMTEADWPTKLKILIIYPFIEKTCDPLLYTNGYKQNQ